jgi:hypothetical protein
VSCRSIRAPGMVSVEPCAKRRGGW